MKKSWIAAGHRFPKPVRLLFIPLLLLLVAGCQRDQIKVYRVAKEQNQPPPQTAPALPTDSPNSSLPPGHPDISSAAAASLPAASESTPSQLTWKTPEGWTEVPPGEMRVASFKIQGQNGKQADVSVIPLPGRPGTDDANVNRWRGQVGLSSVSPEELKKSAESVEAGGQSAQLYDIAGQNPASGEAARILGVIQHRADAVWFFKMTGDANLVEQQKPAFVDFLKSLKFAAAPAQTELPPSHPPIGDMGMGLSAATLPVRFRMKVSRTGRCPPAGRRFPADNFSSPNSCSPAMAAPTLPSMSACPPETVADWRPT